MKFDMEKYLKLANGRELAISLGCGHIQKGFEDEMRKMDLEWKEHVREKMNESEA